jgi:hypothetical protein
MAWNPVSHATDLAVSGGRSVEPGAGPDEAYQEERSIKAEQNGACDDHIPKLCPILSSRHGEREQGRSTSETIRSSSSTICVVPAS